MSQVSPVDHTATYALPSYCTSKVPLSHICQAVQHDERVCVWGIPDLHIVEYAFERGFLATLIDTRKKRKSEPLLNRERPRLYRLQSMDALARASRKVRLRGVVAAGDGDVRSIVLAVFPGYDYVYHYARMVMHVMESLRPGCSRALLEVRRFPALERSFTEWSGLGGVPIGRTDIVVLGHVRDYYSRLRALDTAWSLPASLVRRSTNDERILRETAALITAANAQILNQTDLDMASIGEANHRHQWAYQPASTSPVASAEAEDSSDESSDDREEDARDPPVTAHTFPELASKLPPAPTLRPFLGWWRLFEPERTTTLARDDFIPPGHEALVAELREDPAFIRRASDASILDYLLCKQQAALRSVLPHFSIIPQLLDQGEASRIDLTGAAPDETHEVWMDAAESQAHPSADDPLVQRFSFGGDISLKWNAWAWEHLNFAYSELQGSHDNSHDKVLFLGFRYSYWGDLCKPLAEFLYQKTRFVIYAAKCGTLAGPECIHRVVAPHEFCRITEPDDDSKVQVEFVARPKSFTYVPRDERQYPALNPLDGEIALKLVDLTGNAPGDRRTTVSSPKKTPLPYGMRWLSSVVVGPRHYKSFGAGLVASGLHVSVPTVVGETFAQREQIEAAAVTQFRRRRQLAIIDRFARQEVLPPQYAYLRERLHELAQDSTPHTLLTIMRYCLPYMRPPYRHRLLVPRRPQIGNLPVDGAADLPGINATEATEGDIFEEICRHEADEEESRPGVQQLLSIDDETFWFAAAAKSSGGMFTALHRTTDYVRAKRHRAVLTEDDLSSEHCRDNNRRRDMIDAISGILYKLLRKAVRYVAWPMRHDTGFDEAAWSLAVLRGGDASVPRLRGCLRWGILGAAKISSKFIAAVKGSSASVIVAIASRDTFRAQAILSTAFGEASHAITVHDSYDALLERNDLDAVYVPLPNHMHVAWAIKAVAAGKHALVEKPLGVSAAEVHRLRDAVEKMRAPGLRVHVAEAMLPMYHPLLLELRSEIHKQGGAHRASIVYNHPLSVHSIAYRSAEEGGGALRALGCYTIALALALFDDLAPVAAVATSARRWIAPETDSGRTAPDVTFLAVVQGASTSVTLSCSIDDVSPSQSLSITCANGAVIDVPVPFRPGFDPIPESWVHPTGASIAAWRVSTSTATSTRYLDGDSHVSAFDAQLREFERTAIGGAPAAYPLADSERAAVLMDALLEMSQGCRRASVS